MVRAQPFGSHLLHRALPAAGRTADLLVNLRRWTALLDGGATFGEHWTGGSAAHAWSSTPTVDIVSSVVGLTPSRPGARELRLRPAVTATSCPPTRPRAWSSRNFISKQVTGDKLTELLGVLNCLAAPFGTKEWEYVHFGEEGREFKRVDGIPSKRHEGVGDAATYLAAYPMFIAGYLDADQKASAEEFYAWSKQMSPNVVLSKGSMVRRSCRPACRAGRRT